MKDDRVYLRHLLDCIRCIREFTASGHDEFMRDRKTQDAVLRNLQTLTESATRLSEPAKRQHPEVDWRGIAGFRNVLVHDYLGTNLERIWDVIERDVPLLEAAAEVMLDASSDASG